jgi:O-antigen ligase
MPIFQERDGKLVKMIKQNDLVSMAQVSSLPNYHNYYVQVIVQMGIIGLFLYLMIFYNILKLDIKDKQYYNLMIIFVSVYSVSSTVENMFHQQFSMVILTLFAGVFLAQYRIEKTIR